MPIRVLKQGGWDRLTAEYPDREVIMAILGICQYGARIGYKGNRDAVTLHPNLSTANEDPSLVTAEIQSELQQERLKAYPNAECLPRHYTASPLGLIDKADGSKRRIHHLSYPPGDPSAINNGIPEDYGAISYSRIEEAIQAIQALGPGCKLVKRDFEAAFRHIPLSPLDMPLLGFQWQNTFYAECFLPFGLRTAPYLFNLFAEVFHWIIEQELRDKHLEASVIHYLDDFLVVIPPAGNLNQCTEILAQRCSEVGLTIKESKNEEGQLASFAGFELDTTHMVIRLPKKKLTKARKIVHHATEQNALSLLDLQCLTGYLNFLSPVIPLGRTFLRRLYNMELHFPPEGRNSKRRISGETKKDLTWWHQVLKKTPERSIAMKKRDVVLAWSDAASTHGLGAFFIDSTQDAPQPGSAFSITFPHHIAKAREHMNTEEMRAVEQVLLHWGRRWKGKLLLMYVDNQAVAHGLTNGTIRGAPMRVLRRCLLLAAEYDLDLQAHWVSTNEDALADALSRADYRRIANITPQLIAPSFNLQRLGFLTYKSLDSQP